MFFAALVLSIACNGCKDDNPIVNPQLASLSLSFSHTVDGSKLIKNSVNTYTNAAGNKYKVSDFLYYISNISLTKKDGSTLAFPVYKLIDAFDSSSHSIRLDDVPNGDYTAISYSIGVDSARNHGGNQSGDLSPTKGMLWTWASGYLFLKLEGFYLNPVEAESYRYHIGTDEFLTKVKHTVDFSIKDLDKKASLQCNVNEFFTNPNTFDISVNNDVQSFPAQRNLTSKLATNMADMIHLLKIE